METAAIFTTQPLKDTDRDTNSHTHRHLYNSTLINKDRWTRYKIYPEIKGHRLHFQEELLQEGTKRRHTNRFLAVESVRVMSIYVLAVFSRTERKLTLSHAGHILFICFLSLYERRACGVFSISCLWLMEQELGAADVERRLATRLRILVKNVQELVQVRQQCSRLHGSKKLTNTWIIF